MKTRKVIKCKRQIKEERRKQERENRQKSIRYECGRSGLHPEPFEREPRWGSPHPRYQKRKGIVQKLKVPTDKQAAGAQIRRVEADAVREIQWMLSKNKLRLWRRWNSRKLP